MSSSVTPQSSNNNSSNVTTVNDKATHPPTEARSDGETNGLKKSYGNPSHKKGWQQRKSNIPQDSASNSPNNQDNRRRGNSNNNGNNNGNNNTKAQQPNENGIDSSSAPQNGNFLPQRRDEVRRRHKKDYTLNNSQNAQNSSQNNQQSNTQNTLQNNQQPNNQQKTNQQVAQQQPNVDKATLDEAIRINSLIHTPQPQISEKDLATVRRVKEVAVECSEIDIYTVLQQTDFDEQKAIAILTGGMDAWKKKIVINSKLDTQYNQNTWSEVAAKKPRAKQYDTKPDTRIDVRPARSDRGDREKQNNQQNRIPASKPNGN